MPDRPLKLTRLIRILNRFGVAWDPASGKGSHGVFRKTVDGRPLAYPVPTSRSDIFPQYVRAARKKFKLTEKEGVTDQEFYGAG